MAKKPSKHGKPYTRAQIAQLKKLAKGNTPTGLIAMKMGRTEAAIYSKAGEEHISLKPTNQSPDKRRKN